VPLIPKELVYKTNEQDLLIELHYLENTNMILPDGTKTIINHDKSKPRSSIQLLGSDQADSHRGFKGDGIVFDEYADQDPANWDAVYKHFFTTTDGWAIFMGTPRGYNHFYDLIEDAKENDRWYYDTATWRDSPYVKEEFIKEERTEAERKGTLSTFLQEVELEFRSVQEAVFPMFDRKVHVVKPEEIPKEGTLVLGMDFGWAEGHPTAVEFILVDREQDWYIFDEIVVTQTKLEDVFEMIKQKTPPDMRISVIVGDKARPDLIDLMASKGLPITPAPARANSVAVGIQLLGEKLMPRERLVGLPKPKMFFTSNCKHTIRQFENYKYKEKPKEGAMNENPIKDEDDTVDAIRYVALYYKFGLNKQTDKIKAMPKWDEYGL